MILIGVLLRNQKFCGRYEIVKDILLFVQHARAVPVLAEFRSAPQVCNRKNAAMLKPQITITHEARCQADIEAAISGQKSRILPVELDTFLMKDEHGHASSIFRVEPELLDLVLFGIDPRGFYF